MEDRASSGHHQAGGGASTAERLGLKNFWRQGEEAKQREERDKEEEEERGRQSCTYTEQRGFSVCHIRTVGSVWNLGSFLRYIQSPAQANTPSPRD